MCFPHFESRRHEHVAPLLGTKLAPGTVPLSDGYGAYEAYAKKTGITSAQCWAHSEAKRLHRLTHSKPLVDKFFEWVDKQFEQLGLLPSNPLTKALAYMHERRAGLRVFLDDPEVAIDTNHIERALRPIPTGRNNANFALMRTWQRSLAILPSVNSLRAGYVRFT